MDIFIDNIVLISYLIICVITFISKINGHNTYDEIMKHMTYICYFYSFVRDCIYDHIDTETKQENERYKMLIKQKCNNKIILTTFYSLT